MDTPLPISLVSARMRVYKKVLNLCWGAGLRRNCKTRTKRQPLTCGLLSLSGSRELTELHVGLGPNLVSHSTDQHNTGGWVLEASLSAVREGVKGIVMTDIKKVVEAQHTTGSSQVSEDSGGWEGIAREHKRLGGNKTWLCRVVWGKKFK